MDPIPAHSELIRLRKAQLVAILDGLRNEPGPGGSDLRLDDLRSMRSGLLDAMGQVEPADLPRVCRELRAVDAELAGMSSERSPEQVVVDDLKARRAARRSASEG